MVSSPPTQFGQHSAFLIGNAMEGYRLQVGSLTSSYFWTPTGMITFVDGVEYTLTSGASLGQTATINIIP
jgi:hypothetical protein